jgi:hypothetical protein
VTPGGATGESQLRLFLSVDILGSTALKGEANYQTISAHLRLLQKAAKVEAPDVLPLSVLPSLDEYDWVAIQQNTFADFHSEFSKVAQLDVGHPYEVFPWKALGDELIYSVRLNSRRQATRLIASFLSSLRRIDRQLASKARIRLKGAAWVAGFPIRNRIVQIPAPEVSYQHAGVAVSFPYPRQDFWGPDMDIGFRLSKCTFPGMCVASASLVELLAEEVGGDPLRFAHVGWDRLKGVWSERPYPVFWAELPSTSESEPTNVVLSPWASAEGPFIEKWDAPNAKREAKAYLTLLDSVREAMPTNFGLIKPYIPEEDGVPSEHQRILKLIGILPKGAAAAQNLEEDDGPQSSETAEDNIDTIMGRLNRIRLIDPSRDEHQE